MVYIAGAITVDGDETWTGFHIQQSEQYVLQNIYITIDTLIFRTNNVDFLYFYTDKP